MKQLPLTGNPLLAIVSTLILVGIGVGCRATTPALIHTLDDFEKPRSLDAWKGSQGVKLEQTSDKATSGKSALRITTSAHTWPTVRAPSLSARAGNWLPYDWLRLDLFNTTGDRKAIRIQVRDAKQGATTVITGLLPGKNTLAIPTDLFSSLELREIKALELSILAPGKGTHFYLDHVRLARAPLSELKTAPADVEADAAMVLDFSSLAKAARQSAFSANVYLPLADAETIRTIKLDNPDRKLSKLTLAKAELEGCSRSRELTVCAFFLAADGWHFNTRTVTYQPGETTTITYSPFDFGY